MTPVDEVTVQARYEEWLRLNHLSMEPGLAGAEHHFVFDDREFIICLPSLPAGNSAPHRYATAFVSIRRTATNEPVQVEVHAVLVTISGLSFSLPPAAASSSHMNSSLYTDEQRRELDNRSNELWFLARRAIDYWLRVVRYHTGAALIGLDNHRNYPGDPTLAGGSLINSQNNRRFYTPLVQRTVVIRGSRRLTTKGWAEIGIDLKKGVSPPIWHQYLMTARQRIEIGDLKAAVVDLATCSELAIRRYIDTKLPADTPIGIRDIVVRTNMSSIFRRWGELNLPPETSIPNFSTVKTLVEVRNAIAHRGEDSRATKEFCKQASGAVQDLLGRL